MTRRFLLVFLVSVQICIAIKFFNLPSSGQVSEVQSQDINANFETIIIVHGYTDNGTRPWILQFGQLYHQLGNYNVISIDWSEIADQFYVIPVAMVKSVGQTCANTLINLIAQANLDVNKIHVIGHSLGCHMAGTMCRAVKKGIGKRIGRLTGLDVALPLFEVPPNLGPYKFSKHKAFFVDAVHTDPGIRGSILPHGDVDFYVNRGPFQPGCNASLLSINNASSCSHQAVHVYWAQTLKNPGSLIGRKCTLGKVGYDLGACKGKDTAEVGEFTNWNATGVFSIKTNNSAKQI